MKFLIVGFMVLGILSQIDMFTILCAAFGLLQLHKIRGSLNETEDELCEIGIQGESENQSGISFYDWDDIDTGSCDEGHDHHMINISNGNIMIGDLDIEGNPFGCDLSSSDDFN